MPSEITTATELDALPEGTTVLDGDHDIMTKGADGQWHLRAENDESAPCHLPAMVLVRPDRPAQPTVQPSVGEIADCIAAHPCDRDGDGHTRDDCPQARAVLALIGGRTEAEAVKGVQRWMALDLHMALGHGVEPPADAEQDWDDWWARMLAEVREHHTEAEVKAEALREAADEIARLIEIQSPDASITISVDTLIRALADRLDHHG